ncbi:MAG: DUF3168 domain-containing protein [Devosia nanyangense]|jgi:hypothetical protein|nr:DUF3168 domain-containing protein [Devosia nanyangense]
MTHPIVSLQAALVTAFRADAALAALIGANAIFDAPPLGGAGSYVVVARHDMRPRDGDLMPGNEHRLVLHVWHADPSRKGALAIAERLAAVAFEADLDDAELTVTHRRHEGTETAIDKDTGKARAALALRFHTEPTL